MKKIFLILLFTISVNSLQAQFVTNHNTQKENNSFPNNLYKGFISSTEYYDIPIFTAYFLRPVINKSKLSNHIILSASDFEKAVSSQFSLSGNNSLGSMDPGILPNTILLGRAAYILASDLLTDKQIDSKDYQKLFVFKKALIYTKTATEIVKTLVKRERPDGSDTRSFFSGHTSMTFAFSTFLFRELNDFYDEWSLTKNDKTLNKIFTYTTFAATYGWAGIVGYSRIKDKKHYLGDVLVGAAVGTLISTVVYNKYFDSDETSLLNNFSIFSYNKNITINWGIKF